MMQHVATVATATVQPEATVCWRTCCNNAQWHPQFFFSRARCAALANHPQHKTASTMAAATVQHKATVQYGAAIKYSVASRVGSSKLNGWGLFYGTE